MARSATPGRFFIHLADPGFEDPPWPNMRRLGPYDTSEEALAQAVADAAQGMGVALGVYDEEASESHAERIDPGDGEPVDERGAKIDAHPRKMAAVFTASDIKRRGVAERKRREKLAEHEALDAQGRDAIVDELLAGTGVTAKDLREAGGLR